MSATSSTAAAAAEAALKAVRGFGNFGSGVELEGAPFDCEGLCVDQSIGNLFVCRFENPSECLAGDFDLLGGLFANDGYELSAVLLCDAEPCMNHWSKSRLRYEPLSVDDILEFYRVDGTELRAYAASFTCDRVNSISLSNEVVGRTLEESGVGS